jgi:hypothetical protein
MVCKGITYPFYFLNGNNVFLLPMNSNIFRYGILILLLGCYGIAKPQQGLRLGFNMVPQFSRANFLDSAPDHFRRAYQPGINLGIGAQYGFNQGISFFTGFLFSFKGYTLYNDTNSIKPDIRASIFSFEIPAGFYLRQQLSKNWYAREHIGLAINVNQEDEIMRFRFPADNPYGIQSTLKRKINTLLAIGVELQHELLSGHFFSAGLMYRHGFGIPYSLDVWNSPSFDDPPYFEMAYTGGYIGLNMSFLFDLSALKKQKGELFFK